MKGLFKTGMREEMEGCKNTTIDNKKMEEGRGYGQHLATPKHTAEGKGWRKVTLDIAVIMTSLHTYHCGEQLHLLNPSFP